MDDKIENNLLIINKKIQLVKNNSLPDIKSKYELNNLDFYEELPAIFSKNMTNKETTIKKPKKILYLKKLEFNPISYTYLNNLKLFSNITSISRNIKKHYSMREINEFTKRKFFPISSQTIQIRKRKTPNNFSKIIQDNNKTPSLSIIDLSNNNFAKTNIKEDNNNRITNSGNKSKIEFGCNSRIINYKKNILKLFKDYENKKGKLYQNKARFVHDFLFKKNNDSKINMNNSVNHTPQNEGKSEEKVSYEVNPKYEYVDYTGITNKIITKLTSIVKYNNTVRPDSSFQNNFLNFKVQSKMPNLAFYENIDDYRNKNYIKSIEKKKKVINSKEIENKMKTRQEIKKLFSLSRKGYNMIFEKKNNKFNKLVKQAFNEKNRINKKLDNLITMGKKYYEQNF